jgi:hypothetical protein
VLTDSSPSVLVAHASHPHHWLIDPPDGALSTGRCKLCGIERSFPNSTEAAGWGSDTDAEVGHLRRDAARTRNEFRLSDEAA